MNWMQSVLLSLGIGILKMAMPMITGGLRELMKESIAKWKVYAETTPYDWDNLVVEALETLLGLNDVPKDKDVIPTKTDSVSVTGPMVEP
jgi:hypothetical protein